MCVSCEREGMNSVVKHTVIVWIGNVAGMWPECGWNCGKRTEENAL